MENTSGFAIVKHQFTTENLNANTLPHDGLFVPYYELWILEMEVRFFNNLLNSHLEETSTHHSGLLTRSSPINRKLAIVTIRV